METSETVVEVNENGRVLWINHGLVKAFVAGFVIAIGTYITSLLNWLLKMPDWPTINDFPISYVSQILLLIVSIFLTLRLVNNFLKKFGFGGLKVHQSEKLDSPKLLSAALGCFSVQFLLIVILSIGSLIMILGSIYVGEAKFKLLIGVVVVGILAFFALARRVSHNQSKAQQETQ